MTTTSKEQHTRNLAPFLSDTYKNDMARAIVTTIDAMITERMGHSAVPVSTDLLNVLARRAENAEKERDAANARADAKGDYAMRMDALAEERAIIYDTAIARAEAAEAKLAAIYAEQTPVQWANRYDARWGGKFDSEDSARRGANPYAIEIAVPLYRHPAPPLGKMCGYALVNKGGRVIDSATTGFSLDTNHTTIRRKANDHHNATIRELHLGREVLKEEK